MAAVNVMSVKLYCSEPIHVRFTLSKCQRYRKLPEKADFPLQTSI